MPPKLRGAGRRPHGHRSAPGPTRTTGGRAAPRKRHRERTEASPCPLETPNHTTTPNARQALISKLPLSHAQTRRRFPPPPRAPGRCAPDRGAPALPPAGGRAVPACLWSHSSRGTPSSRLVPASPRPRRSPPRSAQPPPARPGRGATCPAANAAAALRHPPPPPARANAVRREGWPRTAPTLPLGLLRVISRISVQRERGRGRERM